MFNFTAQPTILETVAWIAYLVPVLTLFLLPARKGPGATPAKTPATAASP
jgi:high-affinity iron transporter